VTRLERAFERLYRRHQKDVYRYAYAVLRNRDDAEDVVQQTFLNAYRAIAGGAKPEKPQHWLISIAHNVCRQRFRESARRPPEVALNEELAPAPATGGSPSAAEIQEALGHLTFNQRSALVARELEGRSYAQIAVLLGVSESAVETLLFRARRALREQLEGPLTCAQAEEALSREMDGELPRSERSQLRGHLRECAECARLARSMRARKRAVRGIFLAPFPWAATAPAWVGVGVKAAAGVAAGTVVVGVTNDVGPAPAPVARADVVKRFVPHDPTPPVQPQHAVLGAHRTVVHRRHAVHRRHPTLVHHVTIPAPAPVATPAAPPPSPPPTPKPRVRQATTTRVVHTTPPPQPAPSPPPTTTTAPNPDELMPTDPPPGKACWVHGRGHDAEHGADELKC
jgi:RNA polymerase sigma-70 factor (ECF subfamily)